MHWTTNALWALLVSLVVPTLALAQQADPVMTENEGLYVIVEASQRPLDGLLVLPAACGPQKAWCEVLEKVVHNDMHLSGVVRALALSDADRAAIARYSVPHLEIHANVARSKEVVWAVGMWARRSKSSATSVEVHVQMLSVRDGQPVELGRHATLSGPEDRLRELGHRVSNVVFGALTGVMGSFDGQLFYSAPAPGVSRAIWLADADGYNARLIVADKSVHMLPRVTGDLGLTYVSFRGDLPSLFRIDGATVEAIAAAARNVVTPESQHGSPFVEAQRKGKPRPARPDRPVASPAEPSSAPAPAVPMTPFGSGPDLQYRTAAMSPDGRIVATINDGDQADLWLLDAKGRPKVNLSKNDADDLDPSWSPDGRKIAFVSDRTGSPQIYVMNADGTGVERMTWAGEYNTGPDWGFGGRIVYSGLRGSAVDILTVDMNKQMQRLTPGRGKRSLEPSWASCGRRVFYTSDEDGAGSRLWMASHDGAVRQPLALPAGRYYTPVFRRAPGQGPTPFRP